MSTLATRATLATAESTPVGRFYDYLKAHAYGKDRAIKGRKLAQKLGVDDDRGLRTLIREATSNGMLVCSGNDGYYVPRTPAEANETLGRLRAQAHDMLLRSEELSQNILKHFANRTLKVA